MHMMVEISLAFAGPLLRLVPSWSGYMTGVFLEQAPDGLCENKSHWGAQAIKPFVVQPNAR